MISGLGEVSRKEEYYNIYLDVVYEDFEDVFVDVVLRDYLAVLGIIDVGIIPEIMEDGERMHLINDYVKLL